MPKPISFPRLLAYLIVATVAGAAAGTYVKKHYAPEVDTTPIPPVIHSTAPSPTPPPASGSPAVTIPQTLLLPIPFTSQAPKANWDDKIFGEGCEEASTLMAAEYLNGNESATLDADFAVDKIKAMADWELENLGYNLDINNSETMRMIEGVYGLKTKTLDNYNLDDIKRELAQKRVVLLPANGMELQNPNFRRPGPPYHMLVVKGYNSLGVVTNDPGTRKGMNYLYSFDTLYQANGEYDHSTKSVDTSKKQVIVVWK